MPRRQRTDPPAAPPAGTDSSDSSAPATPASGTSTSRPSGPGGAGRRKPPPPTVVLLVRHGATTTTGKELPGRAPGLHLSEVGRQQAESVAAHIAALAGMSVDGAARNGASDTPDDAAATVAGDARADGRRRRPTSRSQGQARGRSRDRGRGLTIAAVYSSPLERTRETAAPIADVLGLDVTVDDGLLELDVGDWTGLELKAARKRREWTTIQRYPSGFAFPGGESFVAMQSRITSTLDRLRAAHAGEAIVAVSHADPIRAAVNHAVGAHLDMFQRVVVSPCSLTAIAYGTDGPTVLTVNDTGATGALVAS